jgi:hypothetical protein
MSDTTETSSTSIIQDTPSENQDQTDNIVQETSSESSNQQAQLQATIKNPKASKSEKKEAVKQLKKITFQVDGEDYEEEFDPNDEEYLKEQLQFAKVARKRMQETNDIKQDVLKFLDDLKKNPAKALSDPAIGLDFKKMVAEYMEREIENSKKSPQQLELEQMQEELRAEKEARVKDKEEREQTERTRLTEQEFERYDMLMSQALDKHNFPKNSAVIKRMADYMLIALESGKDISPEDIAPLIKEDLRSDYKEILNSFPDDDALEDFIGKEFVDRIRRKNIAKAKKVASNPAVSAALKTPSTGKIKEIPKSEKKMTIKDFFGV